MIAPGTVLLHDTIDPDGQNLLFVEPVRVLVAYTAQEAKAALAELEAAQAEGLWAAGFLSYELGLVFEERLFHLLPGRSEIPLLWLGLYDGPQHLTAPDVQRYIEALANGGTAEAVDVEPVIDRATYGQAFDAIKSYIAAGDVYQVNLTFKARFALKGEPAALYRDLVAKQPVSYGALLATGEHTVLSRSPELFVRNVKGQLSARPMKGTLKRGRTLAEDATGRAALAADAKNRAENLMITDLLRNDLGRIAEIGSVKVTDLFSVETYRSLHTMTSGITARLKPGLSTTDIIQNLFPCGSITGAPKLRAMEIIHQVEAAPRGLYTGAIGYFAPGGDFCLNVAIRTAVIDPYGNGEIGIGGGIVADSLVDAEYDEALLKMKFFTDPATPVALIETLQWKRQGGYVLLDRHLDRMAASASYFQIPFDRAQIEDLLDQQPAGFTVPEMRVRLLLDEREGASITAAALTANPPVFKFMIAPERVDSSSIWLAHKTTNRAFYDEPREAAVKNFGVDEVVFLNEKGELTEGSITNLFVERNGILLTPWLESGLLPGTLRADLIARGITVEARLTLEDLQQTSKIYLGNSVRGLMRARWVRTE
ncbi:aminodeoxychorismate synthase component I [Devosia sp.]|uniref:aminodeoxychorismate synthase component I n=1 Tax=Devosia sp. TaxID=1871048 RepID=UPI003266A144